MDYQHLTFGIDGPVASITFNRPHKANALNHEHLEEIEHAALRLRDEAEVRAVVFTGAGNHFSSGADLTDPGPGGDEPLVQKRRRLRMGERAIRAVCEIDQITIAAWHGGAMGGGACLATAMDFRIGTIECFMQYPEVDIGLNLMWKSLPLLVHLVGPAKAKRLVAGGERVHGETLAQWGVLDELVTLEALLPRAHEIAKHYAEKPPIAVQMIKRSVNEVVSALDHAIMHMDSDQNLLTQNTEDRRTAIAAYLNKQRAEFSGR